MEESARMLTIADVAAATGLSRKAVARRIERGSLASVLGADNRRWVPLVELVRAGLLTADGRSLASPEHDVAGAPAAADGNAPPSAGPTPAGATRPAPSPDFDVTIAPAPAPAPPEPDRAAPPTPPPVAAPPPPPAPAPAMPAPPPEAPPAAVPSAASAPPPAAAPTPQAPPPPSPAAAQPPAPPAPPEPPPPAPPEPPGAELFAFPPRLRAESPPPEPDLPEVPIVPIDGPELIERLERLAIENGRLRAELEGHSIIERQLAAERAERERLEHELERLRGDLASATAEAPGKPRRRW